MAWKTNFSNGGDRDRAILDKFYIFPETTGNVYFVDSGATGTGDGLSPLNAVTTLDAAFALCTASNGDVVIVLQGHAENITAAAGVDADVAGVTVIGMGYGRDRPVFTFTTATTADIDIDAANIRFENLVFDMTGVDAVAAGIDVNAADFQLVNCEIEHASASAQATVCVLTDANASRMLVQGCHFHGTTDAGTAACVRIVGGSDSVVRDNTFQGAYAATGAIENVTTAHTHLTIDGNRIVNETADGNNKAITLVAGTTGIISNNRMAVIDSTSPAPVTAAGAYVSGNYFVGAAGVTASTLM